MKPAEKSYRMISSANTFWLANNFAMDSFFLHMFGPQFFALVE